MSLYFPLLALTNNDTNYNLNITFNQKPLNLAGYTIKAYQKALATTPDGSATQYGVGTGITVINSALGQIRLTIPHTSVTTPGTQWWRLDITDGSGNISTVFYGPLTIKSV